MGSEYNVILLLVLPFLVLIIGTILNILGFYFLLKLVCGFVIIAFFLLVDRIAFLHYNLQAEEKGISGCIIESKIYSNSSNEIISSSKSRSNSFDSSILLKFSFIILPFGYGGDFTTFLPNTVVITDGGNALGTWLEDVSYSGITLTTELLSSRQDYQFGCMDEASFYVYDGHNVSAEERAALMDDRHKYVMHDILKHNYPRSCALFPRIVGNGSNLLPIDL